MRCHRRKPLPRDYLRTCGTADLQITSPPSTSSCRWRTKLSPPSINTSPLRVLWGYRTLSGDFTAGPNHTFLQVVRDASLAGFKPLILCAVPAPYATTPAASRRPLPLLKPARLAASAPVTPSKSAFAKKQKKSFEAGARAQAHSSVARLCAG